MKTGTLWCVVAGIAPCWQGAERLPNRAHENSNQYGNPAYAEIIARIKGELLELRKNYKDTDDGATAMQRILREDYW